MIIKELELTNFGKFNHHSVLLSPGLNIIYGENEAGKTTLHTFIRGMLFGIEKQRGKASAKDLYTKYEPWENPSYYEGTMRIENEGINYRIERIFHKENKAFHVINEDTGQELTPDEIETLFAGLNESCYYNTVSISQLGSTTDKELETILKNYAANIGATKSLEIDIRKAVSDLDAQKKNIASESRIGEEDMIQKSIYNTKDHLEISEQEQQQIIASIEQKKDVVKEYDEKTRELAGLDAKRLEELAKQNERKDNLYQEMNTITAELEKHTETLNQINEHKEELQQALKDKGIESAQMMEELNEKVLNRSNMPVLFIFLMMASIGVMIGLLVGNYQLLQYPEAWVRPLIFLGAAIVFLLLSIIRYIWNKKKKEKKLEAVKELRQMMERLDAAEHEEVYTRRQVERKKENLENVQNLLKAEEQRELTQRDYSEELKELETSRRKVNDEISKAQWMLEQKQERDIDAERRIDELQVRLEKIAKAKEEIRAIGDAKETIEEIATEIRNSFGRRLNEKASYYIAQITNGKYDSLYIDERLNITVNGRKNLIPTSKLSKGTVEQVYMALRLAAADIIFEKDKKPILLDDAFAMYDNKRMGNTLKFMAESMDQVILFSCHTREKLMADKLGLRYHFIRL